MLTDERLAEIEKIKWCGEHGFIPVELIDEIKRLRAENAELLNMLEGCLHYNEIAEYDNGVSHNGINEGDCHARSHYQKVQDYLLKRIAEVSND